MSKLNTGYPPLRYSWLLFDADDTLFDFPKSEASALRLTLEASGLPFRSEFVSLFSHFNKQVWRELERGEIIRAELPVKRFRLFFEEARLDGDPQTASSLFLQNLALGTDLFDGAAEIIHTLKERYHLAIVTNGIKQVQRPRLEGSAIRNCFEKIFISDEIGANKPSREYFDAVFNEISQPLKETVLIIGDNLNADMQGGVDYGIHTCWYNPQGKASNLPITYTITDLQALVSLLA